MAFVEAPATEEQNLICPKCGVRSMVKKKISPDKYIIVCNLCGLQRGEFIKDGNRDVV
jgi:hypothetical protein